MNSMNPGEVEMKWLTFSLLFAAALVVAPAQADNVVVTGSETLSGVIDGNVIVLDGGFASIFGATVEGNVIVHPGGGLDLTGGTIDGNVQVRGATVVAIGVATINGNVQISESGSGEGIGLFANTILGNVQLDNNDSFSIFVGFLLPSLGNTIFGNVEVTNNNVVVGPFVAFNDIDGNLICSGNSPATTLDNNVVNGNIQCDD